ncbi:cation:proton antiporter [Maridesulfovibrio ferrireducens]|uniref:cation:proton antiporter n=1 Tax=Maridesulfovibrio ferrireducens TaxID=246191 RepID=UPI001A19F379|nr:cation:proton antiporter [Maridesulfovibrio ferrireducens]MBI9109851.1 cation:proton antiporter [Maridesulfovibrio ferrireducens]
MTSSALTLITLGLLFLLGLVAEFIGRTTLVPRVSILIIFGFCIGPSGFNVLPEEASQWLPIVSDMALVLIGVVLGSSLKWSALKNSGRLVLGIVFFVVIITLLIMSVGIWVAGFSIQLAIIYAGIALATAPATTLDVIHESKAHGSFTDNLLKIVATSDAVGLIVFSIMVAIAQMMINSGGGLDIIFVGGRDIFLAVLVGILLGLPMSYLAGRVKSGEPTLLEVLGLVFICGGFSLWLDVSFLLAAMTMGVVVANMARHHNCPLCAIETIKTIKWPILALFFIFAGVSIELEDVSKNALLIILYIVFRIAGRLIGSMAGAKVVGIDKSYGQWMGMALMPQAGIALGMALTAAHRFPELGSIVTVIATATVFFEIVGPVFTRIALHRMGDAS